MSLPIKFREFQIIPIRFNNPSHFFLIKFCNSVAFPENVTFPYLIQCRLFKLIKTSGNLIYNAKCMECQ